MQEDYRVLPPRPGRHGTLGGTRPGIDLDATLITAHPRRSKVGGVGLSARPARSVR